MKFVTSEIANELLSQIDMEIGNWNRIVPTEPAPNWTNYQAPCDAMQLFRFSQHVAGWLPTGKWKILQFDDSTSFDAIEASFVKRLIGSSTDTWSPNLARSRTIVFEFNQDKQSNTDEELLISILIFVCLLFEKFCYLVSSASNAGQLLGIQDGFVYFRSQESNLSGAHELLKSFNQAPKSSPNWILQIVAEEQERVLKTR